MEPKTRWGRIKEFWRRPFGLRRARYWTFVRMLRADGLRWTDVRAIARVLKGAALELRHGRPAGRPRERIRADYAICLRCVMHIREWHACAGCGCFMPAKIAAGGGCWAREIDPRSPIGFAGPEAPESQTSAKDIFRISGGSSEKDPSAF